MSVLNVVSEHKLLTAAILTVVLLTAVAAFVRTNKIAPVGWGWYGPVNADGGLGLQGYDPVALHDGKAVLGRDDLSVELEGAAFRFTSNEHRDAFAEAPQRYLPRFGGYCAFAVSKGVTADADPTVFHVAGGELYVFDSEGVRDDYVAAFAEHRAASEAAWAKR